MSTRSLVLTLLGAWLWVFAPNVPAAEGLQRVDVYGALALR